MTGQPSAIGRCQIRRRLGAGGFAVTDPRIGRGWSLAQFLLPAR